MKDRSNYVDAISGIMIIFMIAIIHITDWVHLNNHPLYMYGIKIFPFFLAWFFYKSGMFFKMPTNYREYIEKCYRKLVKPYLIWSVLSFLIWLVIQVFNNSNFDIVHQFLSYCFYSVTDGCHISNIPLWFILTLFLVKAIYPLVYHWGISNAIKNSICLILIIFAYYSKERYSIFIKPLWLYNTIIGLFFFNMGYLLRNIQYQRNIVWSCFIIYA